MDLLKEFEAYLPRWSDEKHLPIPTKQHMGRWYEAWNDFVKEELAPRWESLRDEYKSLKLKGLDDEPEEESTESIEESEEVIEQVEEPVEEQQESSWDRVQKMMNDME